MIFIIYRWYLIYIHDIYYISVIFNKYPWYLLYIGDIYYISVIFNKYAWYLLYIGDIYYISVIFIIYQWYLMWCRTSHDLTWWPCNVIWWLERIKWHHLMMSTMTSVMNLNRSTTWHTDCISWLQVKMFWAF